MHTVNAAVQVLRAALALFFCTFSLGLLLARGLVILRGSPDSPVRTDSLGPQKTRMRLVLSRRLF